MPRSKKKDKWVYVFQSLTGEDNDNVYSSLSKIPVGKKYRSMQRAFKRGLIFATEKYIVKKMELIPDDRINNSNPNIK
jgi:hypothetical protein